MKTMIRLVLLVALGLLTGIADSSSQVRYTYEQLLGQTVVSNAIISAPAEYADIRASFTHEKVDSRLTPVHLFSWRSNRLDWCGTGTAYVQNNKDYIMTSGHIFNPSRDKHLFFYQKIGVGDPRHYGIEQVFTSQQLTRKGGLDKESEIDAVVAVQGGAIPIQSFSRLPRNSAVSTQLSTLSDTNLVLTSLVKGKKCRSLFLGKDSLAGDLSPAFLLFDYKAIPGESGTGFLGSDGLLYVLMGQIRSSDAFEQRLKEAGLRYTNGLSRAIPFTLAK